MNTEPRFTFHVARFTVFGIVFALLVSYAAFSLAPHDSTGSVAIEFEVARGASIGDVARALQGAAVIRSAQSFTTYAFISGAAHLVKPGFYLLHASDSAIAILEQLVEGPKEFAVRVIEGDTVGDIDWRLAEAGITARGAIINQRAKDFASDYAWLAGKKSLEGFLFPDTYYVGLRTSPERVVRKMLDNFQEKAWPLVGAKGSAWYNYLTIASLVEKEIPHDQPENRKTVAGIIAHRLDLGMGLQIDATVLYAKCEGAPRNCIDAGLRREDFAIDSSYNTYAHAGLPPTPIGNPGEDAINAALAPTKTEYLYYLSNPKTGATIFSKTFEEHDTARAKYLR